MDEATLLVNDPGDATAKDLPKTDLNRIQSNISLVNSFAVEILGVITDFGVTTLPGAVAQLNTLVDDAYKDDKIDQEKIDDLT